MRNRDDLEFRCNVSNEAFGSGHEQHSKKRFACRLVQEAHDSHDGRAHGSRSRG